MSVEVLPRQPAMKLQDRIAILKVRKIPGKFLPVLTKIENFFSDVPTVNQEY
jgi:hypothetical protein